MALQSNVRRTRKIVAALLAAFVAAGGICVAAQDSASSGNQIAVQVRPGTASADRAMVQLTLPEAIASGSLHAVLNGKDVSSRFSYLACDKGACMSAELSARDGAHAGKNVVFVTARTNKGKLVSGRSRFELAGNSVATRSALAKTVHTSVAALGSGTESFLPPTVSFKTLYSGGWDGSTPWLQVGAQQLPTTAACPAGTLYW